MLPLSSSKIKGRLGESLTCDKEVRVLNRITRIDESGLLIEADPKHAELLVKSMGYEHPNGVSTPGVKEKYIDIDAVLDGAEPIDDDGESDLDNHDDSPPAAEPVALLKDATNQKRVTFPLPPTVHNVIAYSERDHRHPREMVATRHGTWKSVSQTADAFTGKSANIMARRRSQINTKERFDAASKERIEMLHSLFWHGPAWVHGDADVQASDEDIICCLTSEMTFKKCFGVVYLIGTKPISPYLLLLRLQETNIKDTRRKSGKDH